MLWLKHKFGSLSRLDYLVQKNIALGAKIDKLRKQRLEMKPEIDALIHQKRAA